MHSYTDKRSLLTRKTWSPVLRFAHGIGEKSGEALACAALRILKKESPTISEILCKSRRGLRGQHGSTAERPGGVHGLSSAPRKTFWAASSSSLNIYEIASR